MPSISIEYLSRYAQYIYNRRKAYANFLRQILMTNIYLTEMEVEEIAFGDCYTEFCIRLSSVFVDYCFLFSSLFHTARVRIRIHSKYLQLKSDNGTL